MDEYGRITYQIPEEESLSTTVSIANKILQFQPNDIASNVIIMRVCKAAKGEKNWKLLDEWVPKEINPDSLEIKPMQLPTEEKDGASRGSGIFTEPHHSSN